MVCVAEDKEVVCVGEKQLLAAGRKHLKDNKISISLSVGLLF